MRCMATLHNVTSHAPFEGATEVWLDLAELAQQTQGMDLSTLAGVPPQAVHARQLAHVGGRLCAEAALAWQGVPLHAPIGRDATGAPQWPAGWTGSISHAAGVAMAAVLPRRSRHDIGLDTEALIAEPATQRAALAQCVHASELEAWTPALQPKVLTLIFSAKEAYYKAVRREVGRMIDFQEMAMVQLDTAQSRFTMAPVAGAASGLPMAHGSYQWQGARIVTRLVVAPDPGHGSG
jgi:enterobactin synthetase component D